MRNKCRCTNRNSEPEVSELHSCLDESISDSKRRLTYELFGQVMAGVAPLVDTMRAMKS